jgi:hypothetical protein
MNALQGIAARQWEHAANIAASLCAKVAAKGGSARDAMALFGIKPTAYGGEEWNRAAEVIALRLCQKGAIHGH